MRTVSLFGPKTGESGAGNTDADKAGENDGGLPTGSRSGNWIRTVSLMFWSGVSAAVGSGKSMRTVSFLGSFGPAMERNKIYGEIN
jgi:hypothetical protein